MAARLSNEIVHAIVLRRRDAGESDRRLTLLTQELGVIDVLAKGARKANSRLSGSSEPMTACIFGLVRGKNLRYVSQCQPVSSFPKLRADFDRISYGLAYCELAAAVLPHEAPADESFAFSAKALAYLEVHESPLTCLIWAQSRLMQLAGFKPEFERCAVTGRSIRFAEEWISTTAGGLVDAAEIGRFRDRQIASAEVLIGAARIVEQTEPPPNLKKGPEVFELLYRFWSAMAEQALPANQTVLDSLSVALG